MALDQGKSILSHHGEARVVRAGRSRSLANGVPGHLGQFDPGCDRRRETRSGHYASPLASAGMFATPRASSWRTSKAALLARIQMPGVIPG
jgi:hypothetical protein